MSIIKNRIFSQKRKFLLFRWTVYEIVECEIPKPESALEFGGFYRVGRSLNVRKSFETRLTITLSFQIIK